MTELELYKFIKKNNIEYHWIDDHKDVIIFIPHYSLMDFINLLSSSIFNEEGLDCKMKYGYICIEMEQICNYFDINVNNVFE